MIEQKKKRNCQDEEKDENGITQRGLTESNPSALNICIAVGK